MFEFKKEYADVYEQTLKYFEVINKIQAICSEWVLREFELSPDDIDIRDSVIFNLLSFNLTSISNENAYERLNKLLSTEDKIKQFTSIRFKELYVKILNILGNTDIVEHMINVFIYSLTVADVDSKIVEKLLEEHPHAWLLPHVQSSFYFNGLIKKKVNEVYSSSNVLR